MKADHLSVNALRQLRGVAPEKGDSKAPLKTVCGALWTDATITRANVITWLGEPKLSRRPPEPELPGPWQTPEPPPSCPVCCLRWEAAVTERALRPRKGQPASEGLARSLTGPGSDHGGRAADFTAEWGPSAEEEYATKALAASLNRHPLGRLLGKKP